ncbi:ACP S-malonyltransferase [Streptomyces sp. NPDC001388]|uniref:ACP S-malonyltransferase n=1 Tax=Streptomyces sp. NPDC001388 TaxID=3364568 RepID=UPI00367C297A
MRAVVFPGQGAQRRGMGRELFDAYPGLVEEASDVLGYSIRQLCLDDPHQRLGRTEYTQPALFVTGTLAYRRWREENDESAFLAGHSLGEYCALHAAGAFDFPTGLRLVQRRGELMARARGGGMAAVVGMDEERLREIMEEGGFSALTIANDNSPQQKVVSGGVESIGELVTYLESRGARCVRLNVSGAFHSPLMRPAQRDFAEFVDGCSVDDPRTPVISNVTARPYAAGEIPRLLVEQIVRPVRWTESVRHLLERGVTEFVELGGPMLGRLIDQIRSAPLPAPPPESPATEMGSAVFRRRLGTRYAYVVGGMYRGITSAEMIVKLGRSGMLGFLGTGGLSPAQIERAVRTVQQDLTEGQPYGVNLLADLDDPAAERERVELLMRLGVQVVEASAFMEMTPALVLYRARGLRRGSDGAPVCGHRVVAKVSRPEVAEQFLAPPPEAVLDGLHRAGALTDEQAELARTVPMSHDITVEADSGGHTDGGVATALMPVMLALRDAAQQRYGYAEPICMGLAGGLGTPSAMAAAFTLGADYVVTGSVNQCTVESGASSTVKDMLQDIGVTDTAYAPAGDLFELGAKVQVLRKGVFFPVRANKLFSLYSHYDSLDEIPHKTRALLERTYFKRSLDQVWDEVCSYLRSRGRDAEIAQAERHPKQKMALVFRWYFYYATSLSMEGGGGDRTNYQVHTGPALGAFNQWVQGTELESWRHRHVDRIGLMLLRGAADLRRAEFALPHRR